MKKRRTEEPAKLLIARHFGAVKDPRVARTRRHPLINVLVIAFAAVICGADGWDEIAQFGRSKRHWFATFLSLPRGTPSADTFRRVFERLEPRAFAACFTRWVQALAAPVPGEVVALDGKSVRGAVDVAGSNSPLHLVQAWASERQLVLGQLATDCAATEPTSMPELLALLELEGTVVTVDAIACRSDRVACAIVERKADYVVSLKANAPKLFEHVHTFFTDARTIGFEGVEHSYAKTFDERHGRREVRRIWAVDASDLPLPEEDWPRLRSMVLVERERTVKGKTEVTERYYLASLPPRARRLAKVIRSRWSIENHLHWRLDVLYREDQRPIRSRNGAQNFALLCKVAVSLLQQEKTAKHGMGIKRKRAGWDHDYLLQVMTLGLTEK